MAYIILDNSFSTDPPEIRDARLTLLSSTIDEYQPQLNLPPALFDWALNAYSNWQTEYIKKSTERGEKEEAVQTAQETESALYERYTDIKALLKSIYTSDQKIQIYGVDIDIPARRRDLIAAAYKLKGGHEDLKSLGDPDVLPDAMIDGLIALADACDAAFKSASHESEDAIKATEEFDALFDADTNNLRVVFNWCISMWGRKDTRLYNLGFVPKKYTQSGGGGEVPAAPEDFGYVWLEPVLQFGWHAVDGATSYQIAFSEDGGVVWEELYSGADTDFEFEPPEGLRQYRVRARNANGYGEWSDIIEYEIEGAPPMGAYPNELTGLNAYYSDFPPPIFIVGHDGQTGAVSYRLKRLKRLITDPDPTNADMPVDNYIEGMSADPYADTDIEPGCKCAYWACGVDEFGVEGEWTGPVICEYPE